MRFGLSFLLIVAILFGAGYWYKTVLAVCDVPLSYRIGSVDDRFNVTEDEVRTALSEAESLWEDGTDRNLFTYDEGGEVVVNFIFDERQERANEEANLREALEKKEGISESVREDYETLVTEYEALKNAYEKEARSYESKLSAYNKEVADWNGKGGAPRDVFTRLESTKESLEREEARLSERTKALNALVKKINALSDRGNVLVRDYNSLVNTYNDKFAESTDFTQGDYTNGVINIYEFTTPEELTIVLAHELGHALGLEHTDTEESIMYHHMEKQSLDIGLTEGDRALFYATCGTTDSSTAKTLMLIKRALLELLAQLQAGNA